MEKIFFDDAAKVLKQFDFSENSVLSAQLLSLYTWFRFLTWEN